jgi:hypothetical protein
MCYLKMELCWHSLQYAGQLLCRLHHFSDGSMIQLLRKRGRPLRGDQLIRKVSSPFRHRTWFRWPVRLGAKVAALVIAWLGAENNVKIPPLATETAMELMGKSLPLLASVASFMIWALAQGSPLCKQAISSMDTPRSSEGTLPLPKTRPSSVYPSCLHMAYSKK